MATTQNPVEPGQVWADCDPRAVGRTIRVDSIGGDVMDPTAVCTVLTDRDSAVSPTVGRAVRIRVRRFRPNSTGYRLVKEES